MLSCLLVLLPVICLLFFICSGVSLCDTVCNLRQAENYLWFILNTLTILHLLLEIWNMSSFKYEIFAFRFIVFSLRFFALRFFAVQNFWPVQYEINFCRFSEWFHTRNDFLFVSFCLTCKNHWWIIYHCSLYIPNNLIFWNCSRFCSRSSRISTNSRFILILHII